jgi:hypothetical protein
VRCEEGFQVGVQVTAVVREVGGDTDGVGGERAASVQFVPEADKRETAHVVVVMVARAIGAVEYKQADRFAVEEFPGGRVVPAGIVSEENVFAVDFEQEVEALLIAVVGGGQGCGGHAVAEGDRSEGGQAVEFQSEFVPIIALGLDEFGFDGGVSPEMQRGLGDE